ncbi:hypothetical protein TanjilG_24476 [Lupinus angustifolius]|uniref:Uncharacterized protein n=1 Tax=Lupinus angustifolius TaxID=3871 RepID=A0A1J7HHF0_LUPAN|nr:hypothetical protein TanjilG_24476 [Lupinus angustifolius]
MPGPNKNVVPQLNLKSKRNVIIVPKLIFNTKTESSGTSIIQQFNQIEKSIKGIIKNKNLIPNRMYIKLATTASASNKYFP